MTTTTAAGTTATGTTPRYSTRELQAAAAALAAGRFATTLAPERPTGVTRDVAVPPPDSSATVPRVSTGALANGGAPGADAAALGTWMVPGPLVRVRAANAGAGASTITLALADAADAAGARIRVLDAAAPGWSGLLGATATELGATDGWRRGRRGAGVVIDRVEEPIAVPSEVPAPRPLDGIDLTVLDAGWSTRELAAAHPQAWIASSPVRAEVLVTRPGGLALSQAEAALSDLEELEDLVVVDRVVVVVVGASRWRDRDFTMAGRHLRTLRDKDAVLFAPLLSAKALPGLGPDPLPKQLTTPAHRLLERVTTITGPLTAIRT
ncbi:MULTISPECIES: hypothetical protein [unclassified Nocardioides]|uniref:hypothetical protein n=1 Tax=unclassified Nocardioides TaxID=2615069 RepID=UPI0009F14196|nr:MULTISPECIES: hypothetical protein [unclassified Nocardioides]GAW48025.1 uncharacterized protein PD653B2_0336 [Nocardioides sp. PD653-B2]GAW53672.1 uncharacterized protein PD653_1075 [Nocardioides sp. PD653]